MARPTKLAEKRVSAVLEVIAAGGSRATAANAAGITPSTLYEWLRRGKKEHNASALDPDHDYTVRELRVLGKTVHVPGYSRLRRPNWLTR